MEPRSTQRSEHYSHPTSVLSNPLTPPFLKLRFIDQHYYAIASKATLLSPAELPVRGLFRSPVL